MTFSSILAIDPSSKCCGFALGYRSGLGAEVITAGRFQPKTSETAVNRIRQMLHYFGKLVTTREPTEIVIEIPSGKIHRQFSDTKLSALAVYGMAVGAIWATCRLSCFINDDDIHLIDANEWTAGRSKNARRLRAKCLWGEYSAEKDPGADESDAICLLDWFCHHQELERLKKS